MNSTKITVISPINIALVKYWGKADESRMIPLNSSFSITLNHKDLCTNTTVELSETSVLNLNGRECGVSHRIRNLIEYLRSFCENNTMRKAEFKITSENNFPTAAGLASSASGMSALAVAIGTLFGVKDMDIVVNAARIGSGSACRSMYGGFVEWKVTREDGMHRQIIRQVFAHDYWSELVVVIAVTKSSMKEIGSTDGMKRSTETSELLSYRSQHTVNKHMDEIQKAISDKNFEEFCKIIMKESNQFHACCLDSYPPIFYLNSVSHLLIKAITLFNTNTMKVAYTFDAGPNAVLVTRRSTLMPLLFLIQTIFPPVSGKENEYFWNPEAIHRCLSLPIPSANFEEISQFIESKTCENDKNLAKNVSENVVCQDEKVTIEKLIVSNIGEGASLVPL